MSSQCYKLNCINLSCTDRLDTSVLLGIQGDETLGIQHTSHRAVLPAQCSFFSNMAHLIFWGIISQLWVHRIPIRVTTVTITVDLRDRVCDPGLASENTNPFGLELIQIWLHDPSGQLESSPGLLELSICFCNSEVAYFTGYKDQWSLSSQVPNDFSLNAIHEIYDCK